jgi:hypothetical protein
VHRVGFEERSAVGRADLDLDLLAPLQAYALLFDLDRHPLHAAQDFRVRRVDALEVEVDVVDVEVRERPGEVGAAAEDDAGNARDRHPRDVVLRRADRRLVPDARQTESEVRIVRDHGAAEGAARRCDDPVVAAEAGGLFAAPDGLAGGRHFGRDAGDLLEDRRIEVAGELARPLGPESAQQREQLLFVGLEDRRELARHEEDDRERIGRRPGLRRAAQELELGRQVAAARRHPGVHARGVRLERGAAVVGDRRRQSLGRAPDSQTPHLLVVFERPLAEKLGETAGGGAPRELHLEEAVVGVQPAERHEGVAGGAGANVRHRPLVETDVDCSREPAQRGASVALRKPAARQPEQRRGGDRHQEEQGDSRSNQQLPQEHGERLYRADRRSDSTSGTPTA